MENSIKSTSSITPPNTKNMEDLLIKACVHPTSKTATKSHTEAMILVP